MSGAHDVGGDGVCCRCGSMSPLELAEECEHGDPVAEAPLVVSADPLPVRIWITVYRYATEQQKGVYVSDEPPSGEPQPGEKRYTAVVMVPRPVDGQVAAPELTEVES